MNLHSKNKTSLNFIALDQTATTSMVAVGPWSYERNVLDWTCNLMHVT